MFGLCMLIIIFRKFSPLRILRRANEWPRGFVRNNARFVAGSYDVDDLDDRIPHAYCSLHAQFVLERKVLGRESD